MLNAPSTKIVSAPREEADNRPPTLLIALMIAAAICTSENPAYGRNAIDVALAATPGAPDCVNELDDVSKVWLVVPPKFTSPSDKCCAPGSAKMGLPTMAAAMA